MTKNRMYTVLGLLCLVGYIWLFFARHLLASGRGATFCYIKTLTGIPCPSCGSTRAVSMLIDGNLTQAITTNPLGIVIALFMLVLPPWILYDVLSRGDSLYRSYRQTERIVRKPWVAALLIAALLVNWIWNINKQL